MTRESASAESYRLRAEELRTCAELDENARTREALKQIASEYDRMAARADAIDSANQHGLGRRRDVA